MLNIGCHLPNTNGLYGMASIANMIGGNTFQFFLRNPISGKLIDNDNDEIDKFKKFSKENSFSKIVAHSPYTINLCSSKVNVRKYSMKTLENDLLRMDLVEGNLYNLHPGCHTGLGIKEGIKYIAEAIGHIFSKNFKTTLVLEMMSGKGTEIGSKFSEIAEIIYESGIKEKIGVCFDTCHMSDAGFDFQNLDKILEDFDKIVGIDKLKLIHLNDNKNPIGSRKDRHEKIGHGYLGIEVFKKIVNNRDLKNLPFILETPGGLANYAEEIAFLKGLTE
ncbi:MAG: deoxyribonuclease IV [Firmicutes bacterium]|nr:deoxyribonuclease IV [Bacillota bacterium]